MNIYFCRWVPHSQTCRSAFWLALALLGAGSTIQAASADTEHAGHASPLASKPASAERVEPATKPAPSKLGIDIKKALRDNLIDKKNLLLVIKDKPPSKPASTAARAPAEVKPAHPAPSVSVPLAPATVARVAPRLHLPAVVNPRASRDYIRAKAALISSHEAPYELPHEAPAHEAEVHWSYSGAGGPQAWGRLKPEFSLCASGKRQSPINIEDLAALHGPAEALQFNYQASSGTVVNNGHSIELELYGDNTLTVRGSVYKLLQMHFHTPSEEQINYRSFAMVAHLVHKDQQGQLAVLAILLEPGVANSLIHQVWTYMPLDVNDRVRVPAGLINMNELLPKDQRYYQFMGSLTTPPCTEGVLWMVLKTPTPISQEQLRLFQQLYPNNARPVQALNARPVRSAE